MLSHALNREVRFGSPCSSGPRPRGRAPQACSDLGARTRRKFDVCAPPLGQWRGQAPRQLPGAEAGVTLDHYLVTTHCGNIWHTQDGGRNCRIHQNTSSYTSKPLHQHPPLDEFAMMLEKLFTGTPEAPVQPNHLTEEPWTLQELMGAVEKLKSNKSGDECGLVAEVFKHIPTNFAAKTLQRKFYAYTMICLQMVISHRAGDGLCSRCWQNIAKRHWSRSFGRLLLYDCSTKFLPT